MNFRMADNGHQADSSRDVILSQAYQPILRGYFAAAASYYLLMSIAHMLTLDRGALLVMLGVSITAAFATVAGFIFLKKPRPVWQLEAVTLAINLLILTNIFAALQSDFRDAKLVYYVVAVMVFAFASVTMRQALVAIALALVLLASNLVSASSGEWAVYGFIAFAAGLSAVSIAFFLRRTIEFAVASEMSANTARNDAEHRLKKAETLGEVMRRQSLIDSLTELPNRRAFYARMRELREDQPNCRQSWLILLDLDGFKAVNDNHGHIIGDKLLEAVARRLRKHCEGAAFVSRMGGDEFSIILEDAEDAEEAAVWCEKLVEILARVYLIEDRLVMISGSIGCHAVDFAEKDAKLIQNADFALLYAKRNGKNRVVLFDEQHGQEAEERFRIEQALRVANFSDEIELVFQPQYDLDGDNFMRAEVLARWHSPKIGDVGPEQFIKIAEESGLIAGITIAVLKKSILALKMWDVPFPVAINLSGSDLLNDQMVDEMISLVKKSAIDPAMIEFEVTETAMMSDIGRAKGNLGRLSALGHPIALDDFGTGYSNFNYLRTLPIDKLKVDRSFLEDLADPTTEKILRSLVGVARTLDVPCLLEGVESEFDLLVAKRVGAQAVQGFLFGQPLDVQEMQALFRDTSSHAPSMQALSGGVWFAG